MSMMLNDWPSFQSTLSMRRATINPGLADAPFIFQSTLSMRRATLDQADCRLLISNFNPRSP